MAAGVLGDSPIAAGKAAKLLSLSGLFPIYKPKGPTSAEVLNRLKEKLLTEAGIKQQGRKRKRQALKIGHGGTLDSAASGVLVVGIGKGTKMLSKMLTGSKYGEGSPEESLFLKRRNGACLERRDPFHHEQHKYTAVGELGRTTDTLDATGKITEEKPYGHIMKADLERVLLKFTGDILQVPPLYSALKKDGQRLSSLVKKGKVVDAKPARPVTVYGLWVRAFQSPIFTLDVECGGGFYVRSLVSDIGRELSSCAYVKELTRTKQGPFTLEQHALQEEHWTIDGVVQALEDSMRLLPAEPQHSTPKSLEPDQGTVSSGEE